MANPTTLLEIIQGDRMSCSTVKTKLIKLIVFKEKHAKLKVLDID